MNLLTKNGTDKVTKVISTGVFEEMYDLSVD